MHNTRRTGFSPRIRRFWFVLCLALVSFNHVARAADWQWSVPMESVTSSETNRPPEAFLWVPPGCQRLRGVIVAQNNMEEAVILENPKFRAAMGDLNFGEIWISPAFDFYFRFDQGAGAHFDAMMAALADESGYSELTTVPVVPMGHSAAASFPWNFAAWNPGRTLCTLSISGQWPYWQNPAQPNWGKRTISYVPGLVTMGEYEDAAGRASDGLAARAHNPRVPITMLQEPGAGHFDASDAKIDYIALYIKKAVQYRLPQDWPIGTAPVLTPIDSTQTGWLADRWHPNSDPSASPAPVGLYAGDAASAFWYFDQDMARATEALERTYSGKKTALLGFTQDGQIAPQNPKTHQMVTLKFRPGPDGNTFQLGTTFLDTVPAGPAQGWTGEGAGDPIPHPDTTDGIKIVPITGAVAQVSPGTFRINFNRVGTDNSKRTDIWLYAVYPGDDVYRRIVQQALLPFPVRNTAGTPQAIQFPAIPDQRITNPSVPGNPVELSATASSGNPVSFYVDAGPAEVDGNTLRLTAIPPRAKFPVKVTVVAWQWGSGVDPKVQTATPVSQSFYLLRSGDTSPDPATLVAVEAQRSALWAQAKAEAANMAAMSTASASPAAPPASGPTPVQAPVPAAPAPVLTGTGNVLSFHLDKQIGMGPGDLAGAESRVGHWNNISGVTQGATTTLAQVQDENGQNVPGVTVTVTGGSSSYGSNSFDASKDPATTSNDTRLYNGMFDQNEGAPTTVQVTGIPFAHYNVYLYRRDDGAGRAGKFTVGETTYYIRGGCANPTADGGNYVRSTDSDPGGTIAPGNYVEFENLSGTSFTASFTAISAGDNVERCKFVGFQIVQRP